jgi:spermidine synthase
MYHVIGTTSTAVLLYLISYIFYRIGYYSLKVHQKLWNSILAVAFIISALAGLFMALQITYKWDIPFIKSVLKWHVEFGIGLAVTGLFHLIWHLSYFTRLFKTSENIYKAGTNQNLSPAEISANLFIVGFVTSSIQLLLIREMMNITGGYELITGTFLGSWLIGSAIGAAISGKSYINDIKKINLVFSLSPLVSLFFLFFFTRLFLTNGETPSFLTGMIYTLLVLLPVCFVSGFTFVKLISIAGSDNNITPGRSFAIETTGGLFAGLVISFLTSGVLNTYQILLLIIILSVTYVLLTFYISNFKIKMSVRIFATLLSAGIIILNPDIFFRQILLQGIRVTNSVDTPYGNITYGKYKGVENVYYNQRLLIYNDDIIEREEDIHYAMLQSKSPEKVILISGSLHTDLPEILKYPVKKIIYIERDPLLAKQNLIPEDTLLKRSVIANKDAFTYIRDSEELVDVIILLIPPPSTLLLNRYYTTEFFRDVKKRLKVNGVFMCSPGPGDDYFSKEAISLYSSVFNSLSEVFKNIKPVVGNKLYLISSDNEVSVSFCKMTEMRKIKNSYVCADYLEDDLIIKKSDEVISLIDHGIRANSAAFPIAYFHFQSYLFSKNLEEKVPAIILILIVFAFPVFTVKRKNLIMYFSTSALAGFEIIILLILQLIIGNMYQMTGIIIAGIMTGLAVGAGIELKFLDNIPIRYKGLIIIVYYLAFASVYNYIVTLKSGFPAAALIIFSAFLPSLFTGHIFRDLSGNAEGITTTAGIYSADLAGAAFGFIVVSGIAIPAFGIRGSIYLLSTLIFAGFLFGTIRNKK